MSSRSRSWKNEALVRSASGSRHIGGHHLNRVVAVTVAVVEMSASVAGSLYRLHGFRDSVLLRVGNGRGGLHDGGQRSRDSPDGSSAGRVHDTVAITDDVNITFEIDDLFGDRIDAVFESDI